MAKTETSVPELKINYLTEEQYKAALDNGEINENELYMTPSSNDSSGSSSGSGSGTESSYTLPLASSSVRGGVKTGYTQNGKNYPVQLDNEKMYVNVPWTDTVGGDTYTHPTSSGYKHIPSGGYSGQILRWSSDGTAFWDDENVGTSSGGSGTSYTLPLASYSTRGGVRTGYSQNGKNYPVELSNEQMYVNVPWSDTIYNHPTSSGYKHIPSGGSSGQVLKWSSSGTAYWADETVSSGSNYSLPLASSSTRGGVKTGYSQNGKNYPVQLSNEQMYVNVPWSDTTYSTASTYSDGLMSSSMVSKLNGIAANANNYTHPTGSGYNHIPSGGYSGQILKYSSSGTAYWANESVSSSTVSSLQSSLNSKADSSHTHSTSDISNLFNAIYPVGAIYISVNSTSPSTLFGGTWEQIKDVFLLSAGSTYSAGSTGGSATHTLSVDEIPSHRHANYYRTVYSGGGSYVAITSRQNEEGNTTRDNGTLLTGGGAAHNNMPPYLTVYMWKRTS